MTIPRIGKESIGSLSDLQSGINRLFEQLWHAGIQTGPFDGQDCAPALELIEKDDRYEVLVELPGLASEDVEVSCTSSELTVHGQKLHAPPRGEGDRVLIGERRYGSFRRTLPFASAVLEDKMSARLEKGVLHIVAPKKVVEASAVVRIPIREDDQP